MKILILLTVIACLQVSARGFGQSVTLSLSNAPLEQAFKEIKKQTGYSFVFTRAQLKNTSLVTCQVKNAELKDALDICFRNQPLSFVIEDRYIVVQTKGAATQPSIPQLSTIDISGRVINENGDPLPGVTITANKSNKATSTNERGEFSLMGINDDDVLIITSVGYYREEIQVNKQNIFLIRLRISVGSLDETIVIAYGTTTRRLNTGSVSKVTSEEISKQPVSNPLAALQGRVPGLLVTQSSGLPGSAFFLQIRGRNSLSQGTQPLFIIDGVQFMMNSISLSQSALTPTSQSPFNNINPADIESIEILKDADAIAIYGSQGANGVVLVTTKKGKTGRSNLDINFYTGFGKVTRSVELLNTPDYIRMRREAYINDGITPNASIAPDLVVWDTTRYTDWKKLLIGETAKVSNLQATITGGNIQIQYLLSTNYYSEVTVFPGDQPATRGGARLNVSHTSVNNKFNVSVNTAYSVDNKKLSYNDLTRFIYLAPNAPAVYDSAGNLNWPSGFDNPMSYLFRKYNSETNSLIANANFQYKALSFLNLKLNAGYNLMQIDEQVQHPIKAQRPSSATTGSAELSDNNLKSWIIEPQAEFKKNLHKGVLDILAGLSFQQRKQYGNKVTGAQFTNDDLLGNISSAGLITATNKFSQYNYAALFGRINYNIRSRYIFNINLRRDGSSRFGSEKRFSNFGAFGGAWIFSEENFVKRHLKFISFGKIRGSIGVTGNDQIGDYQYLDSWTSTTSSQYQGSSGILPTQLYNPIFEWERNKKLELALEAGLFNNRVLFTAAYYRNKGDNQLVFYKLPTQTGFSNILKNLDANLLNKGFEIAITSKNIVKTNFQWQTNFNITIPSSKLLKYPGLEISSDRFTYMIDQPLDIFFGFEYLGVNDTSGAYQFRDLNNDGRISTPGDIIKVGRIGQKCYGGIQNSFTLHNLQIDVFVEFRNQTGKNYLATNATRPGAIGNQPVYVLSRWQKPGDFTDIQRFTTTATNPAFSAYNNYRSSSALITDASYIRLKNISISYRISKKLMEKIKVKDLRIYVLGQNLLTITKYEGADPETQNLITLPPLRILTAGIQVNL